jgi:hypothetical protein
MGVHTPDRFGGSDAGYPKQRYSHNRHLKPPSETVHTPCLRSCSSEESSSVQASHLRINWALASGHRRFFKAGLYLDISQSKSPICYHLWLLGTTHFCMLTDWTGEDLYGESCVWFSSSSSLWSRSSVWGPTRSWPRERYARYWLYSGRKASCVTSHWIVL